MRHRGSSLIVVLIFLFLLFSLGVVLVNYSTTSLRRVYRHEQELQALFAAEGGLRIQRLALWRPFRISQDLGAVDQAFSGASESSPANPLTDAVSPKVRYASGVISYQSTDQFMRRITIRSVGWVDLNDNQVLDAGEIRVVLDDTLDMGLPRSRVFDYAYFANNYGWFYGLTDTTLVVAGDVRANGDMEIRPSGTGSGGRFNGSLVAAANNKLDPPASGTVTGVASFATTSSYVTTTNSEPRWRPGYTSKVFGTKGAETWEAWRDVIYDADAALINGRITGATLYDTYGTRKRDNTMLDPRPSREELMPDLSDISYYEQLSRAYVDNKTTWKDGTPNPNSALPAYIDVWNSTTNGWDRLTSAGVANSSLVLIGTDTKPIRVHGPVTVKGDVIIKGVVEGQGTIYTERNVHIVGDIIYKNPPDFRQNSPVSLDATNENRTILGLAARGSIIMGSTKEMLSKAGQYMKPPFTKRRKNYDGTWIPAYDGTQTDSWGFKRYQTIYKPPGFTGTTDDYIDSLMAIYDSKGNVTDLERPAQIDAILYTNNLIGGYVGRKSGSTTVFTVNGTYICKDEATVPVSGTRTRFIWDMRIRDRGPNRPPIIDLDLPRAPSLQKQPWRVQYTGTGS